MKQVYIVEDTPGLAHVYEAYLRGPDLNVSLFDTGRTAIEAIEKRPPHVILLDLNLPDANGLELLRKIKAQGVTAEVIIVTGQGSVNVAVEAMRAGAFDFVMKLCTKDRLRVTVRNALDRAKLATELAEMQEEFGRSRFVGFIGNSEPMQPVYRTVRSSAPTNATIFITGESGTGKEVCASAIHVTSRRSRGPFVTLNCGAIARDLLESELFGHVKGAFTGATADRMGAALTANGGTLFLDEVCEMDLALQVKLLRFLQEKTVQRVGEDKPHQVDVRIICATNRDPVAEVSAGRFREDLFYRLQVIPIELPPLRERSTDILLIAEEFLSQFSREESKAFRSFSAEVQDTFLQYGWPGNVRQLQNVVRNVVVLNDGQQVSRDMLPSSLQQLKRDLPTSRAALHDQSEQVVEVASEIANSIVPLETTIMHAIKDAIVVCGGSIPKAAMALEVSPSTLYRRIQSWQEPVN